MCIIARKCTLAACMSTSLPTYYLAVIVIDLLHMDCLIRKKNTQITVATSTN